MSLALAVMALCVRLLVPTGYMLSAGPAANGMPTLVICTGRGTTTLAVDPAGKPDRHAPKETTDHPCAFSGGAATHGVPTLVSIGQPFVVAVAAAPAIPQTQRPGLGLAAPPPPTTGPPSIT